MRDDGRRRSASVVFATALLFGAALLHSPTSAAQTLGLVHRFSTSGEPWANLLLAHDGLFYGTTSGGGPHGAGTAFRIDASGEVTTLHSFGYTDGAVPLAALIQAQDGYFYGTTSLGGSSNRGTVFRMDARGDMIMLHSFSGAADGAFPQSALLQAADGSFYGTTPGGGQFGVGTFFRIDSSGTLTTLYEFQGFSGPAGPLIQGGDGFFYGTSARGASGNGSVFRLDAAGDFEALHAFSGMDGASISGTLIQAKDGLLYGTATYGGQYSAGTAFRMDVFGGSFAVLHDFDRAPYPQGGLIQGSDGSFYGTSLFAVFRMDASGSVTVLHDFAPGDGASIYAPVVEGADGRFYGTTSLGGENGYGTVYWIDASANFSTLHHFTGSDALDGAPLIQGSDGAFYGASGGGAKRRGAIFRLDAAGAVTVLHSFSGPDGEGPSALLQAPDGLFYGTTWSGGAGNWGTVFRIDSVGRFTTLYDFKGSDGVEPVGPLILADDGNFYGATFAGGAHAFGTVFRMTPAGALTTLHDFDPGNGEGFWPGGGLLQAKNGRFYGVTLRGGVEDAGTVYRIDSSGHFSTLDSFDFTNGSAPHGTLIQASDGKLYGTANFRVVFRVDAAGRIKPFHVLTDAEGWSLATLIYGTDGNFYGTTPEVPSDRPFPRGSVFRMDMSGNVTTIHAFSGSDGTGPGSLVEASDGSFYGTTTKGGLPTLPGYGVIFRLAPAAVVTNAAMPSSGPASGGSPLELFGAGFRPGTTVTVGGLAVATVTVAEPVFLYGSTPALVPGTLNDVIVASPGAAPDTAATLPGAFFADFLDVPQNDTVHGFVEMLFRAGITAGCGAGNYCPDDAVTRAQIAVDLLKAEHGPVYAPPACAGAFPDVACPGLFADWIEELALEGITVGCGGGLYCPGDAVTREQMAVLLLKTREGPAFTPPPATGVFVDVPKTDPFAPWIEQLFGLQITAGCQATPLLYCPGIPNTRGQLAAVLVRAFELR